MSEGNEEPEYEEEVVFTEGGHMPDHFRGAKTQVSLLRSDRCAEIQNYPGRYFLVCVPVAIETGLRGPNCTDSDS